MTLARKIDKIAVSLRLLKIRGLAQAEFCRQIGVQKNAYNPFERGYRLITVATALKIKQRFGVSLDWIYGTIEASPSPV